jgi:hypothetical protein
MHSPRLDIFHCLDGNFFTLKKVRKFSADLCPFKFWIRVQNIYSGIIYDQNYNYNYKKLLKRNLKSDDQYVGDSPPIIRSFVSISDNFLKQGAEL